MSQECIGQDVPVGSEIGLIKAAELLNVSRPFLMNLLDAGEIAYRLVGGRRRVETDSLRRYLRRDYYVRLEKADELAALAQEMGLD